MRDKTCPAVKRHPAKQIANKPRMVQDELARGLMIVAVSNKLGITDQRDDRCPRCR